MVRGTFLLAFLITLNIAIVYGSPLLKNPGLINQRHRIDPDGGYYFEYETIDGQKRVETGEIKIVNGQNHLIVSGYYSFKAPNGNIYMVKYASDELGFKTGASEHLSPMDGVLKSIKSAPETTPRSVPAAKNMQISVTKIDTTTPLPRIQPKIQSAKDTPIKTISKGSTNLIPQTKVISTFKSQPKVSSKVKSQVKITPTQKPQIKVNITPKPQYKLIPQPRLTSTLKPTTKIIPTQKYQPKFSAAQITPPKVTSNFKLEPKLQSKVSPKLKSSTKVNLPLKNQAKVSAIVIPKLANTLLPPTFDD